MFSIMIYIVELSFSTKKMSSIDTVLKMLDEICIKYNCIEKYYFSENKEKKYNYESIYILSLIHI